MSIEKHNHYFKKTFLAELLFFFFYRPNPKQKKSIEYFHKNVHKSIKKSEFLKLIPTLYLKTHIDNLDIVWNYIELAFFYDKYYDCKFINCRASAIYKWNLFQNAWKFTLLKQFFYTLKKCIFFKKKKSFKFLNLLCSDGVNTFLVSVLVVPI